jgi:hypothetical protein
VCHGEPRSRFPRLYVVESVLKLWGFCDFAIAIAPTEQNYYFQNICSNKQSLNLTEIGELSTVSDSSNFDGFHSSAL